MKNSGVASRLLIKPKSKSDQKAVNLKSYYECHIWGLQKGKNYQNISIGRGCMNFENLAFQQGGLNMFLTSPTKMASA